MTAAKMSTASRPSRNTMMAESTTTVVWLSWVAVSVGSTPSDWVVIHTSSPRRAMASAQGAARRRVEVWAAGIPTGRIGYPVRAP